MIVVATYILPALKDKISIFYIFFTSELMQWFQILFTNTHIQKRPFLNSKCQVIWNGYDQNEMTYKVAKIHWENEILSRRSNKPEKNGSKLIQAAIKYFNEYGEAVEIAWAGRFGKSAEERTEIEE